MKIYQNNYKSGRYYRCTYAMVLDHRHPKKGSKQYPVTMRFTIDRKSYVFRVEGECTEEEFDKICNLSNKSNRADLYEKKRRFDMAFWKYQRMVEALGPDISLDRIRVACTKIDKVNGNSFVRIWEDYIHKLQTENGGERYSTGESYKCALISFKECLGEKTPQGFRVDLELLQLWDERMRNGLVIKGETVRKPIADATRGIYLRNCRAIWNECRKMGYLNDVRYPFSNKQGSGLIAIPKGGTRKNNYVPVEKMKELYDVFVEKRYPDSWDEGYTFRVHRSLGLFLAQYLCNGFNLEDEGLLEYNDFYFSQDRKAFLFIRRKTEGRTGDVVEVIVPIIEQLQYILDDIAATPEKGKRVFPWIFNGVGRKDGRLIRKYASQANANIRSHVRKVCLEVLGWENAPSCTWARHSFATNLTFQGVSTHYISESMGHTQSNSVTNLYIASYPLEKQMEYNRLLLEVRPTNTVQLSQELLQALADILKKR